MTIFTITSNPGRRIPSMETPRTEPRINSIIKRLYGPEVEFQQIGEGGTGQVVRVEGPQGVVALKYLDPKYASSMRREVAALAKLENARYVLRAARHGLETEYAYIEMNLLEGTPLDQYLAKTTDLSARVTAVQRMIMALSDIHPQQVVHKDVKPANAMVMPTGSVVVLDFGLAQVDHRESDGIVGTPLYMAPEQAQGYEVVQPAADVYAAASILYEALNPQAPLFKGMDGRRIVRIKREWEAINAELLSGHSIPQRFAGILKKALDVNYLYRPSAREFADEIGKIIEQG